MSLFRKFLLCLPVQKNRERCIFRNFRKSLHHTVTSLVLFQDGKVKLRYISDGLQSQNGAQWKKARSYMSPVFSGSKMKQVGDMTWHGRQPPTPCFAIVLFDNWDSNLQPLQPLPTIFTS